MRFSHIADDFASIARRMKEIEREEQHAELPDRGKPAYPPSGWINSAPVKQPVRGVVRVGHSQRV